MNLNVLESILQSNYAANIDALYVGFPSFDLHFYKVSAKFSLIGEPCLEILHLNAFMGDITQEDWFSKRQGCFTLSDKEYKNYSIKSISLKYNERILEFVRSLI